MHLKIYSDYDNLVLSSTIFLLLRMTFFTQGRWEAGRSRAGSRARNQQLRRILISLSRQQQAAYGSSSLLRHNATSNGTALQKPRTELVVVKQEKILCSWQKRNPVDHFSNLPPFLPVKGPDEGLIRLGCHDTPVENLCSRASNMFGNHCFSLFQSMFRSNYTSSFGCCLKHSCFSRLFPLADIAHCSILLSHLNLH